MYPYIILKTMTNQNDQSKHKKILDPNRRNLTVEERIDTVKAELQILEKRINPVIDKEFCSQMYSLYDLNKELINSNSELCIEFSKLNKIHCPNQKIHCPNQ